jgi:hypothetical protein
MSLPKIENPVEFLLGEAILLEKNRQACITDGDD